VGLIKSAVQGYDLRKELDERVNLVLLHRSISEELRQGLSKCGGRQPIERRPYTRVPVLKS